MLDTKTIKAKCKVCGRMSPSQDFKLDYRFNTVVCGNCIKDKDREKEIKANPVKAEPVKPAGWDAEDQYLERRSKEKPKDPFAGMTGSVLVKCKKCKYEFTYNIDLSRPKTCPYCDTKVRP